MGISDRLFSPPAADVAKLETRQADLSPQLQALVQRAGVSLAGADPMAAQPALRAALALAPAQPDVLRLYALLLARTGNLKAAISNFESALRAAPDDAMGYWEYARAREDAGQIAAALDLRERAVQCIPDSPLAWADLGEHLFAYRSAEASLLALERAVELAPDYAPGLFKLGNAYVSCGRTDDGATMIRRALECEPAFGAAWIGLVDIKTVPVMDEEITRMRELLADGSRIDPDERTAIEFALAMACERRGEYAEAWARVVHANARRKHESPPWHATNFRARERLANDLYAGDLPRATDPTLGAQVIFVVGMPRSGTTLVEQILAAHPDVHGADELPALPQVLAGESARRQQQYPEWIPEAGAADWQRLGEQYLEATARFRQQRRISTDKLPNNWRAIGAIRAMLPGAHIVICRRDPLENCWSCFKQYFADGWQFTYDISDLVTFWKGFDRAAESWSQRDPDRIRKQHYERLTESPESEIRSLLAFCGLAWDDACMRFHESNRGVQTLSAAQVRQPIHRHRSITDRYGALMNPLRTALGLPEVAAAPVESE